MVGYTTALLKNCLPKSVNYFLADLKDADFLNNPRDIDPYRFIRRFGSCRMVIENLKTSGVQQAHNRLFTDFDIF